MKVFEGTDMPDDFLARVAKYLRDWNRSGEDAIADAVLAILGRPLTDQDRRAIVMAAQAGTLTQSMRGSVSPKVGRA